MVNHIIDADGITVRTDGPVQWNDILALVGREVQLGGSWLLISRFLVPGPVQVQPWYRRVWLWLRRNAT